MNPTAGQIRYQCSNLGRAARAGRAVMQVLREDGDAALAGDLRAIEAISDAAAVARLAMDDVPMRPPSALEERLGLSSSGMLVRRQRGWS